MENPTTKQKITDAAILLYSERGFDNISMRDIASAVGITAGSIYNHFKSKQDILKGVYEFYAEEHRKVIPSLEDLYNQLEVEPVQSILMKLGNYWQPYAQNKMDRIILIASQRIRIDEASENFIREHFFEPIKEIWVPLLNRAIKLGKIEPVDTGVFTHLASYCAYGAVNLNRTAMKASNKHWINMFTLLMTILKPGKNGNEQ